MLALLPLCSSPPQLAMAKSWIMAGRGIAKKIRNATQLFTFQLGELVAGAYVNCPNCQYCIDNSHVTLEWPELPAGVKFDPSDFELLEHLEAKSSLPNSKSLVLLNEFIPTIEESEGICYTHPENLPGIKMDGSSRHFFYRISNAYNCGKRKRRKINNYDHSVCDEHIRWHKTGKSKAIYDNNGVQKGWKKILVLYTGSKRGGSKSGKAGWVMHQYHLGADEDEKDGELVVSKIIYQLPSKQIDKSEMDVSVLDCGASDEPEMDVSAVKIDPTTPKADPPQPHSPNNSPCETEQYTPILLGQGEEESGTSVYRVKDEAAECPAWPGGLPQVVVDAYLPALDEAMRPEEAPPEKPQPLDCSNMDAFDGLPDLDNTLSYLGTPSARSTLADIHFGSQDSLGGWPGSFSTQY
ncbi:SUPPRESSOR OF GAMMA RESPONSE 1-like [Phragmites australis]|uniref:SUPPRESSOR OF GAMMA RESPONSE 1-like n=1 Tax=Phragmites australis TaxID=29695 RepID=UPI002D78134E|nr:SUPPRESSOR OF GAMMA RESPONSE 1-like [Phragmites australis]